jgi:hypothetical protein
MRFDRLSVPLSDGLSDQKGFKAEKELNKRKESL